MQELLGTFLEMIPNHWFDSLKQFEETDLLKLIKLFNQVFKTEVLFKYLGLHALAKIAYWDGLRKCNSQIALK